MLKKKLDGEKNCWDRTQQMTYKQGGKRGSGRSRNRIGGRKITHLAVTLRASRGRLVFVGAPILNTNQSPSPHHLFLPFNLIIKSSDEREGRMEEKFGRMI